MPASHSKSLVKRLLDNPMLPAYVQQLDSPTLGKLIERVGAEDAQEFMALATREQMTDLVEMEAWTQERPGREEQFDPDKFLEWIEIWHDMGPEFMAAKLVDLGEDLLSVTLMKYVTVVDMQKTGLDPDADDINPWAVLPDNFGPYAVIPDDEAAWPQLNEILSRIWSEESDYLERVLARACTKYDPGVRGFSRSDQEDKLSSDIAWSREENRTGKGFVTPLNAALFLSEAKNASIDDLLIKVAWDWTTRDYLARFARARAEVKEIPAEPPSTPSSATSDSPSSTALWRELDAILVEEKIARPASNDRLLAGPKAARQSYLRRKLAELAKRDPHALQVRQDEVLYLANVLVSGTDAQGGVFTEEEAAKAVYATCNLGVEYCVIEDPFDSEEAMVDSFLLHEPGLIKAFEIGYHLIAQLPNKALSATARELMRPEVRRQLREHDWLQEQIGRAIGGRDPQGEFTSEALEKTREIFDTLSLLFDGDDCHRLRVLCDPFPCFPKSLEPDAVPQIHVDDRLRYITEPSDLRRILEFLETLRF